MQLDKRRAHISNFLKTLFKLQYVFSTEKPVTGFLTLLHSERPKLYTILAFLSAIGLTQITHLFLFGKIAEEVTAPELKQKACLTVLTVLGSY